MSKVEEIMSRIESVTDQMIMDLGTASYIDLADFVDERDQWITELLELHDSLDLAPFESRIMRILEQDKLLSAKMIDFKEEAQKTIQKFQAAEKYKQVYDKEYTLDSVYFNKKK
ncbi:hypothetical protein [Paenibacillus periandrae]|uniref:hypothetical protein n=1 Tax=Paenibacillus periandrae TaxID=1761741 RepID=UPI001F090930|nr:hypothetical protein [Paenibacillus periandrae]